MSELWGIIQSFGALVGLATGAFVVWDRVIKDWPLAFIVARPLSPGGMAKGAYLRFINRSKRPLLVNWKSGQREGQFGVASDHSSRAIIESILPGDRTEIVESDGTTDLLLLKPMNFSEIDPENIIDVDVFWSYAQPVIWKRPRRIHVRITKKAFLALLREGANDE